MKRNIKPQSGTILGAHAQKHRHPYFHKKTTSMTFRSALALAACLVLPSLHAETTEWASYGQDYSNQRQADVSDLTPESVQGLQPIWTVHTGVKATFQASPIIVQDRMVVSLPMSGVLVLNAHTGEEIWRYKHTLRWKSICCGPANRGVAVSHGRVFIGTVDGRLLALSLETGQVLWDSAVAEATASTEKSDRLNADDPLRQVDKVGSTGIGIGMAPIAHDGLVYVAVNGVGYGLHPDQGLAVVGISDTESQSGFVAAYDEITGVERWRWKITDPHWEGTFKNSSGDGVPMHRNIAQEKKDLKRFPLAWQQGGGSIYASPALDPERHLLFVGTGNPSPQMADDSRPGDNLYTSSLVALDSRTGKKVWAFQQIPHDRWGYDVASPPILMTLKMGKKTIPAVASASKLGWVYVHDRVTGKLLFKSDPFVPQRNLFQNPRAGDGVMIAPGIAGGANWSPGAYSDSTGLMLVPGIHLPTKYILHQEKNSEGKPYSYVSTQDSTERGGTLTALNLNARGKKVWQVKSREPWIGGVAVTSSGVVFSGSGEQHFSAFDLKTGEKRWDVALDAGVNAPPVIWSDQGEARVAVVVGGNSLFATKVGDTIAVFGLRH
jgi:glucose dehydrogenase